MNCRFRCTSSVKMEGRSRQAAAASAVLPVPDELIVEILARLPAKSLCLCKCVSRAWRALISDPANRRRIMTMRSGYGSSNKASTSQIYLDQEQETYGASTQLHFIETAI